VEKETRKTIGRVLGHTAVAAALSARKPWMVRAARVGFLAKGFLFVIIGALAIMLTNGVRGGKLADARGALASIAEDGAGRWLLLLFVFGAVAHGIWNLLRAAADFDKAGRSPIGIIRRGVAYIVGFFYIGLALSALEIFISARGGENSEAEETFVAVLLSIPIMGRIFLWLIGLFLAGAAVNELYSGITGKFRDAYRTWELKGINQSAVLVLGVISFSARAVLLGFMGYFFLRAAVAGIAGPIGMDEALRSLLVGENGPTYVALIAAGLIAHGMLAFYEARFRRIN
jgi:hypothetical protein